MNIQAPVELLFWTDGISWSTRGRSSMAALRVQLLSPELCSVPPRLCASASPSGTSCQIGPCGSCGCTRYPLNTPKAVLVAGMPMALSQHPCLGIGQASPAKCLLVPQLLPNHPQLQPCEGEKQAEVRIYIKYGINV